MAFDTLSPTSARMPNRHSRSIYLDGFIGLILETDLAVEAA